MFEETLRIDYSNHILGMRLNFWIALLRFVGGLVWFVAIQRGWTLAAARPTSRCLTWAEHRAVERRSRPKAQAKQVA